MATERKDGALQVWWIPQVGMSKVFTVDVATPEEGGKLLEVLAQYDLYQWKNRIKPDYSNAGGLRQWDADEGEWLEWDDPETGDDINEYMAAKVSA
jgi:hypothetical protein